MVFDELGISGGTVVIILIALYFVIKWAVKNGIREVYEEISGKEEDDLDDEDDDLDDLLEEEAVGKDKTVKKDETVEKGTEETMR